MIAPRDPGARRGPAYLRLSLTDRCNLRCVYCLPEQARFAATRAGDEELRRLTTLIAQAIGVHKVRLTGGEPTLCDDLVAHVRHARMIAPVVGLTSNGILLAPLLPALREAGLNRLNISLDAVDPESFRRIARRDGLDRVIASIRSAQRLGFAPLKVDAVAMQDTDVVGLARFALWEGVQLRFIELMAIGEARALRPRAYISAAAIRARLACAGIVLRACPERDEPTARMYAVDGHDPEACAIGFVTTVSAPFCASCDRLRLSSQGRLHTCLMDERGHDLLSPLRAGDEAAVHALVGAAWAGKAPPARQERYGVMAGIGG